MDFFTICAVNYLPMARVLANSIRVHHPQSKMVLLLCDKPPDFVDPKKEPFDAIIEVEELPIPDRKAWIFKHDIPELCTAVKGIAFQELFRRFNFENLVYLDPDIVLFSPLKVVEKRLAGLNVLLSPHFVNPRERAGGGLEELNWMAAGIYNLGFLAVKNSSESHRFLSWWSKRCYEYAYYSPAEKLFFDQPFLNYTSAFFDSAGVLRDTSYNAAYWNMDERKLTGSLQEGFYIDDQPLAFFHFTHLGYRQEEVFGYMKSFGPNVLDLTQHYLRWLEEAGRSQFRGIPWSYSCYDDGKFITAHQRKIYRLDPHIQIRFPDPFQVHRNSPSYRSWYQRHYSFSVFCSKAWSSFKDMIRPVRDRFRRRRLNKNRPVA